MGRASIDPAGDVIAGSYGTWRLTYVAGAEGVAPGGRLRIHTDSDTDWGVPQFDDPAGAEYMTFQAPAGVRVTALVQSVTALLLVVQGRALRPDEQIVVTYGDRSGGGPGSRAQTFREARRYFWVDVDAGGTGTFVMLPDSPYVSIVGGPAVKLAVVAPSTVAAGEPFRLLVRAEDAWGNPAHGHQGTVSLHADGVDLPASEITFGPTNEGVYWLEGCVATQPGVLRIDAAETNASGDEFGRRTSPSAPLAGGTSPPGPLSTGVERGNDGRGGTVSGTLAHTQSNPIGCTAQPGPYTLYWGDPHGGQVALAAKIPDFFGYGRDVAGIAFAGYQRNDHVHSNEDWAAQQATEREFHQPGRFVPLPGFEWSAEPARGGHHNVYFRRHSQPMRRNSHRGLPNKSDADTDLPHVLDLHRAYRGADVTITPHVGGGHADLRYHEPSLEPALEMTSTHGSFEWFLRESLERGYRMGFAGGSDSHDGRTGHDSPGYQERRFAKSGLTGLYASELTLEAIHEALRARRCYATTGARILVDVRGDDHAIGEEYRTSAPPTISVFVAGTAPLESVELFRGLDRIYHHPIEVAEAPNRVRLLWQGASRKTSYSGVIWDGSLRIAGDARARIGAVEPIRFDSPRSHVYGVTPHALRWHSVTCGYRSGLIVDVEHTGDDTELQCAVTASLISRPFFGGHGDDNPARMAYSPAERVTFGCSLRDLARGPQEIDVGLLERKVTLSLAPAPGGEQTAEFTFLDRSPAPGINAYWVRVVQADMEMAWTSPIFVDFVAPPL
ncbi:MAG: DUF3604 domain-containing protein [Chloroflexi bacterium]|nr:DUF3604 domain-containing protein [Chloroflexota bacterium]